MKAQIINLLVKAAIIVLPEIFDRLVHAMQSLVQKSDNKIDDEIVAQIIVNKDKIITAFKQK